jgi:hypothetical protein
MVLRIGVVHVHGVWLMQMWLVVMLQMVRLLLLRLRRTTRGLVARHRLLLLRFLRCSWLLPLLRLRVRC